MCQRYICRPNWSFADVVSIYILQALHCEVTNEAASWALWAVAGLGSKKRLRQLLPKYLGTAAVGSLYSSDTIWSTLERLACWHQSFEACRLVSSAAVFQIPLLAEQSLNMSCSLSFVSLLQMVWLMLYLCGTFLLWWMSYCTHGIANVVQSGMERPLT